MTPPLIASHYTKKEDTCGPYPVRKHISGYWNLINRTQSDRNISLTDRSHINCTRCVTRYLDYRRGRVSPAQWHADRVTAERLMRANKDIRAYLLIPKV